MKSSKALNVPVPVAKFLLDESKRLDEIAAGQTRVKHWSGFLSARILESTEAVETWRNEANEAEKDGDILLVFRAPKDKNGGYSAQLIKEIEAVIETYVTE